MAITARPDGVLCASGCPAFRVFNRYNLGGERRKAWGAGRCTGACYASLYIGLLFQIAVEAVVLPEKDGHRRRHDEDGHGRPVQNWACRRQ